MTGDPLATNTPAAPPIYVGFWLRLVAFLIDNIWIPILVVPLLNLLPGTGGSATGADAAKESAQEQKIWKFFQNTMDGNPPDMNDLDGIDTSSGLGSIDISGLMASLLLTMVAVTIVFALCWWLTGTTPGKWVIRARIVDAATLKPPSMVRSVVRGFAYYASLLPFGLGFVWIAVDAKKRGFHDLIAGTVVIRKEHWFGKS